MSVATSYAKLVEIEAFCGGSFFLADLERFEANWRRMEAAFQNHYPNSQLAWSYKSNYLPAICQRVEALGGLAEVVSEIEFDLALQCGVDPARIVINGPALSTRFFERALAAGAIINVDHVEAFREIVAIQKRRQNPVARLCIRCNFDLEALGLSRFGLRENEGFYEIVETALRERELSLVGLHYHYCPPIRTAAVYGEVAARLIDLARRVFVNDPPEILNFGGGYMSPMPPQMRDSWSHPPPVFEEYGAEIAGRMAEAFHADSTKLVIEPGVSLVADAMSFFCRVKSIKKIGRRNVAIVSGSIFDIRPTKSKRDFPITVYSPSIRGNVRTVEITGYTCMEEDTLHTSYTGAIEVGDLIQFHQTGAYTIVLKPPFINPAAPIVSVDKSGIQLLRRRETFADLFATFL